MRPVENPQGNPRRTNLPTRHLRQSPRRVRIEASQVQAVPIMNDSDFIQLTENVFTRIQQALEDADLDFELPADGILEVEFDDGSKLIINRHSAAREIWVAARSGGYHFDYDANTETWVLDSDRSQELFTCLSRYCSQQAGEDVQLLPG